MAALQIALLIVAVLLFLIHAYDGGIAGGRTLSLGLAFFAGAFAVAAIP